MNIPSEKLALCRQFKNKYCVQDVIQQFKGCMPETARQAVTKLLRMHPNVKNLLSMCKFKCRNSRVISLYACEKNAIPSILTNITSRQKARRKRGVDQIDQGMDQAEGSTDIIPLHSVVHQPSTKRAKLSSYQSLQVARNLIPNFAGSGKLADNILSGLNYDYKYLFEAKLKYDTEVKAMELKALELEEATKQKELEETTKQKELEEATKRKELEETTKQKAKEQEELTKRDNFQMEQEENTKQVTMEINSRPPGGIPMDGGSQQQPFYGTLKQKRTRKPSKKKLQQQEQLNALHDFPRKPISEYRGNMDADKKIQDAVRIYIENGNKWPDYLPLGSVAAAIRDGKMK